MHELEILNEWMDIYLKLICRLMLEMVTKTEFSFTEANEKQKT